MVARNRAVVSTTEGVGGAVNPTYQDNLLFVVTEGVNNETISIHSGQLVSSKSVTEGVRSSEVEHYNCSYSQYSIQCEEHASLGIAEDVMNAYPLNFIKFKVLHTNANPTVGQA